MGSLRHTDPVARRLKTHYGREKRKLRLERSSPVGKSGLLRSGWEGERREDRESVSVAASRASKVRRRRLVARFRRMDAERRAWRERDCLPAWRNTREWRTWRGQSRSICRQELWQNNCAQPQPEKRLASPLRWLAAGRAARTKFFAMVWP